MMNKKAWEEMVQKDFQDMKEAGMNLQDRVTKYFDSYLQFGRCTEVKVAKMVRETGMAKEEVLSLVGTILKSKHKGFVTWA